MSTDTVEVRSGINPAYLPFQTFDGFLAKLKANTVPPAIDKSMLGNLSGGVQSHLLLALKFLGLTEGKQSNVTPALEKLVESYGTEGYKPTLREIITHAYAGIVGDINIANATAKQLDDAFAKHKVDGLTRERAIRFYLKALSVAGVPFSPFLGKRKPKGSGGNGSSTPKTRKPKNAPAASESNNSAASKSPDVRREIPDGTREYPLFFKNKASGSLVVPSDLTLADCKVIELQLAVLKAYAADDGN